MWLIVDSFDVLGNLRLLPKFSERDPESFFSLFERVADARNWPDSARTLMLQCVLTGRVQEVCSSLTDAQSQIYSSVKSAVLKAYELILEAYRQRFRTWKKGEIQGISVILGNDLAGARVWADVSLPVIVAPVPMVMLEPDENERDFPEAFTACAVTRAMAALKPESLSQSEKV